MPKTTTPCSEDGCWRPRLKLPTGGVSSRCGWHWLAQQNINVQELHAARRLVAHEGPRLTARTQKPVEGGLWCSGCQSYVPDFYYSGSACRACRSRQQHRSHVQRTYGLDADEYDRLLVWQWGRCYICARVPRSRRLAVDHDHVTGAVRGLLCADDERGCNHAIVGVLEAAAGQGNELRAARRLADYLERSPLQRLRAGEPRPDLSRPGPPKPVRVVDDDPPPF